MTTITPAVVVNYGPLVVFFAFVLGLLSHWYFKIYPEERKERANRDQMMFEQVALSRQALETSNLVITQNSEEMKDTRASHTRIGERLECVEHSLELHDEQARQIAQDVAVIKSKVSGG